MPKISVVIPCFNGEKTIRETLESVLNQTLQDLEVIVVDDGSTDRTQEILGSYHEKVRVVHQANSGKSSAARNAGIRAAHGEYIAVLDADDLWLPQKLQRQLQVLEDTGLAWCYCDCEYFQDWDGKILGRYSRLHFPARQGWIWKDQLFGNRVCSPTPLIKKALLETVGLYDESLASREDWDLWLRVAMQAPVAYQDEVLARYRVHPASKTYAMDPLYSYQNHLAVIEKLSRQNPQWMQALKAKAMAFYAARFSKSLYLQGRRPEAQRLIREAIHLDSSRLPYHLLRYIYRLPPAWISMALRIWRARH